MQENRTYKTLKNTLFGFFNRLINILMPFITRTVIIYVLGMEYAGLNSLFSSVLQVLNLAEMGISSAVVYCMYKPMAEEDHELIAALLKFMRKIYYIIGWIILVIGILLIPMMSYFVNGSIPKDLNLTVLYSIYLINTGIGYFFFAYKSTLLYAGQKIGVINNINSGIILIQNITQIIIIVILKNYYLYLGLMPLFSIINNFWIFYATKKYYPHISCRGDLPKSVKKNIITKIKGLFVTKICTTTRNAFDTIFISAYIGLTTVAIYGNYYYLMSAVVTILNVVTTAMMASVGNSLVTESVEKNYYDLRRFNFLFNWFVGFCTCCLLTMYQPFMKVWMGENALFPFYMVILICIYFYFLNIGSIRAVYHDAAGLWWEARYRAVFEAILNLGLNLLLTRVFGVFGTVLGTLIALIIVNYGYGTQIIFKYYFKNISLKEYFFDNGRYAIVTLMACIIVYFITDRLAADGVWGIIIPFAISLIVFNGIYLVCFFQTNIFKQSMYTIKNIVKNIKV